MIMKYAFTAVFTPEENGVISVDFPDLQGCSTCGDDMSDAIFMAQDVLNLTLYDMQHDREPIPEASRPQDIIIKDNQFTSIIAVDTEVYRRFYENKSVKKTLTIPMWLNERAEVENINFSRVLQDALKDILHVQGIN